LGSFKCGGCNYSSQSWKLVNTGIGFTVPDGIWAGTPRSGVSTKGISVNAGVIIDKTYTGIVKVLLVNHSLTVHMESKKNIIKLLN
jgi:dUTPase